MFFKKIPQFDQLKPGQVFEFAGPRVPPFFLRGSCVGVILGLEIQNGIVHVMTFRPKETDEESAEPDIMHLPICYSAWRNGFRRFLCEERLESEHLEAMQQWRKAASRDEVGAFDVPLRDASRMAWESVLGNTPDTDPMNYVILTTYPKRDSDGLFRILHAVIVPSG